MQGDDVVQLHENNGITLMTNNAHSNACVYRTAEPRKIDISQYPHVEADVQSSGNTAAYGQKAGQWFSFWMYPPGYSYAHGDGESGEVDFVENIPHVRTNFAGCKHDCHETEWGVEANEVYQHITMHYDANMERVNVYRCEFGADTCPTDGEVAYVDLPKMQVNPPYTYTFCADVWYAQPGQDFTFSVYNVRILSSQSFLKHVQGVRPFNQTVLV